MPEQQFPPAYWHFWDVDAAFAPGDELPPDSRGRLWAVLVFVFYGDKVVLADIQGRGLCIPSGHIEAGETLDEAAARECFEEVGARLHPAHRRLIGCYRLVPRSGDFAGQTRFCPVFVAEALGFEPIPETSESRGLFLASWEDVADLYFFWDPLLADVFAYAEAQRQALFPAGTPLTELTG
ncbi:MAG: NUDIX domain-containing protein [Armatimonadota bacterium]|nr:NUDIX domain-containing protein [Armatimonadota bacterium]